MGRFLRTSLKLVTLGFLGMLALALRYLLKTPQPLESALPGEARLYKWTRGHIFYKVAGAADAPPLLLVHPPGVGASGYEMHALMQELQHHFRVYTLDLLGFGLSDHPQIDYSVSLYTDLINDFLAEVIGRPALVLAGRQSCAYVTAGAANKPDRYQGLVLLPSANLFAQPVRSEWLISLAQLPLLDLMLYGLVTPRIVLRQIITWQRGFGKKSVPEDELTAAFTAAHQLGAHHAALAFLSGELDMGIAHLLGTLQQPTLLIWRTSELSDSHALLSQHALPNKRQVVLLEDSSSHDQWSASVAAYVHEWHIDTLPVASKPMPQPSQEAIPTLVRAEVQPSTTHPERSPTPQRQTSQEASKGVEAYCVKCRQKRSIVNPQKILTKNGRQALSGTCPVCDTKLFRFISEKGNQER